MPHRLERRSVAALFLLVTLGAAGCASDDPETADPTVGSNTSVSPSLSSSSSSSPTPRPPAPSPPSPAPPAPPTTPPRGTPSFIASATWGDSDHGVTLRVAPTPSALGAAGPDAAATAWAEVLDLAPDAATPGMREQFDCHWTWARLLEPDKLTWNLEPWRPVVPVESMLLEGCNPGGPEV